MKNTLWVWIGEIEPLDWREALRANAKFLRGMEKFCEWMQCFSGEPNPFGREYKRLVRERKSIDTYGLQSTEWALTLVFMT